MVYNSIGLITFLNPYISLHMGDLLGKEAVINGKSIKEFVLEKQLLTEEELDEILCFESLIRLKYRAQLFKK